MSKTNGTAAAAETAAAAGQGAAGVSRELARQHEPAGRDGGNSRNGHRPKMVLTDTGPVEISVPRDLDSSSGPVIVAKRQRRLSGVDDLVISLVAKGLATGEVQAHLAEVYGAQVSRETISHITGRGARRPGRVAVPAAGCGVCGRWCCWC